MSGVEVSIGFRWDTCNNITSCRSHYSVIIDLFENFRIIWFLLHRVRSRPWGKREELSYCHVGICKVLVRKYDKCYVLIYHEYIYIT